MTLTSVPCEPLYANSPEFIVEDNYHLFSIEFSGHYPLEGVELEQQTRDKIDRMDGEGDQHPTDEQMETGEGLKTETQADIDALKSSVARLEERVSAQENAIFSLKNILNVTSSADAESND